jgi:hypothetical protein
MGTAQHSQCGSLIWSLVREEKKPNKGTDDHRGLFCRLQGLYLAILGLGCCLCVATALQKFSPGGTLWCGGGGAVMVGLGVGREGFF